MAVYDLEEQEQIAELKAWWKENGKLVIALVAAVLIGVAATLGWRAWQHGKAEAAAQQYAALEKAAAAKDVKAARGIASALASDYAGTAYAPMGALVAAKVLYDAGDRAGAAGQLQWVLDHGGDDPMVDVARLRLARIQYEDKKYPEALRLLEAKHGDAYAGLYNDLKGDVLAAQGKPREARDAYVAALAGISPQSPYRPWIQLKLDALGGPPGPASPK